mgnify:CR=1 FL=1
MTSHPMTEDELQAYVDDVLLPERRAAVEAHLARHPADAERVAAYRAQKQALKALFQPVLDEPLPERLQALSVQPLRTPGGGGWTGGGLGAPWQRLVAGLLVAALGGVVIGGLIVWLIEFIRTWLDDPLVESAIGLVAPYFVYWLAEEAHGHGLVGVERLGLGNHEPATWVGEFTEAVVLRGCHCRGLRIEFWTDESSGK